MSFKLNLVNGKKMVEQAKTAQHVFSQKSKAVREMQKQGAVQSAIKHKETEPMNCRNA